jgi:hypothetical protein
MKVSRMLGFYGILVAMSSIQFPSLTAISSKLAAVLGLPAHARQVSIMRPATQLWTDVGQVRHSSPLHPVCKPGIDTYPRCFCKRIMSTSNQEPMPASWRVYASDLGSLGDTFRVYHGGNLSCYCYHSGAKPGLEHRGLYRTRCISDRPYRLVRYVVHRRQDSHLTSNYTSNNVVLPWQWARYHLGTRRVPGSEKRRREGGHEQQHQMTRRGPASHGPDSP